MSDRVSANTDDLLAFSTSGDQYSAALAALMDDLETARASTRSALGSIGDLPASSGEVLHELLVESQNNNEYVRDIYDALMVLGVDVQGLTSAPAAQVEAALLNAGHVAYTGDRTLAQDLADRDRLALDERSLYGSADLDGLDQSTRNALVVASTFDGIFDGDATVEDFARIASGGNEAEIRVWLESQGLSASEQDEHYNRIITAAEYFAADRGVTDDPDADYNRDDFIAGVMTETAQDIRLPNGDPAEPVNVQAARDWMIHLYAQPDMTPRPDPRTAIGATGYTLVSGYNGDSPLGMLSADEQELFVDSVVSSRADALLTEEEYWLAIPPDWSYFDYEEAPDGLVTLMREAYADAAVTTQLRAGNGHGEEVAAMFYTLALDRAPAAESAELVSSMTGMLAFAADGSRVDPDSPSAVMIVSEAELFAAAGHTDVTYGETAGLHQRMPNMHPFSLENRVWLTAAVVEVLAADGYTGSFEDGDLRATGLTLSDAESDFVATAFAGVPYNYVDTTYFDGQGNRLGAVNETYALALGMLSDPGDGRGHQVWHAERINGVLETDNGQDWLGYNPDVVDPATHQYLVDTLIWGREQYPPGDDGATPTVYWTDGAFDGDGVKVMADLTVDLARNQARFTGQDLDIDTANYLVDMVGHQQVQDIVGFNEHINYGRRDQIVSILVANQHDLATRNPDGEWTSSTFDGSTFEGSGLDNPWINAEVAVFVAQAYSPTVLTAEQRNQIRDFSSDPQWLEAAGLRGAMAESSQGVYLTAALDQGWTNAVFDDSETLMGNNTINWYFAEEGRDALVANQPQLDSLSTGDADPYIRAALATGFGLEGATGGHPALRDPLLNNHLEQRLIPTIEDLRIDGTPIETIPVQLTFEGQHPVTTYLFKIHTDEGIRYVDIAGEHFDSVKDWDDHTRLPPARYTITGTTGGRESNTDFVSPLSGEDYTFVSANSEAVVDSFKEEWIDPFARPVAYTVGGILILIPPTTAIGIGVVAATGATQVAEGGYNLYQINSHGGDWTDLSDPRVRADLWSVGEGALAVASAGAPYLRAKGLVAPAGATVRTVNAANVAEGAYSAYETAQLAHLVYTDWDNLSEDEQLRYSLLLGLTAVGEGAPFVASRANLDGSINPVDAPGPRRPGQAPIDINALRLDALNAGTPTAEVYILGELPSDYDAARTYLSDPNNWEPGRRAIHDDLIARALADAMAFHDALPADGMLIAMRGNTAAGKTRGVQGVKGVGDALTATGDLRHFAVNPDNFKVDLIQLEGNADLTSSQVHLESSILAERFRRDLLELPDERGKPVSMLIDQRFGDVDSIIEVARQAKQSGRRLEIYDVDAPLELSLVGVLMRDPAMPETGPIPPFEVIGPGGFVPARKNRQAVVELFENDPSRGKYTLFATEPDGAKVAVATVKDGELVVTDEQLYYQAIAAPSRAETEALAETVITESYIDQLVGPLAPGFDEAARVALEPHIGRTWEQALDEHGSPQGEG